MRLVIAAVVVFALTYALTDGLDLNTRWLFASFPLVMGALLGPRPWTQIVTPSE